MKKIFLVFLFGLFFIPRIVKADSAIISMDKFIYNGNSYSDFAINDYYTFKFGVGWGPLNFDRDNETHYIWQSKYEGYCDGNPSVFEFDLFFDTGEWEPKDFLKFVQATDSSGNSSLCTFTSNEQTTHVKCSATNSNQITILYSLYYPNQGFPGTSPASFFASGISRHWTFNCDRTAQMIQDSTGAIINNNNQNTNSINANIGAMGSSINSNIDGMKEKQDVTNDKLEEANQTSKGILGKIGDLLSSIIELPGKLVSLLIEGLKNLFVPTDEQLYEIINDSKDLAENFGFVGESMNFFITIFTSLLGMVNANGCVEFPEFTIGATSLTPSITFWTAHNVCLNDNPILSSNITTIRTITSIVLVALFINFAVSKFFSILNKNDSGTTYDVASDGTATITDWTRTNGDMTRVRR